MKGSSRRSELHPMRGSDRPPPWYGFLLATTSGRYAIRQRNNTDLSTGCVRDELAEGQGVSAQTVSLLRHIRVATDLFQRGDGSHGGQKSEFDIGTELGSAFTMSGK